MVGRRDCYVLGHAVLDSEPTGVVGVYTVLAVVLDGVVGDCRPPPNRRWSCPQLSTGQFSAGDDDIVARPRHIGHYIEIVGAAIVSVVEPT